MNKQELLDKAVFVFDGVWPSKSKTCVYMEGFTDKNTWCCSNDDAKSIFTKDEFQQRARELGYINGYRWGVEYPTNGKKPDLDSSILVYVVDCHAPYSKEAQVIDIHWPRYDTFEIIDERYKPADASYLQTPTVKESLTDEWYDYDNQKAIGLPPVGVECEFLYRFGSSEKWSRGQIRYVGVDLFVEYDGNEEKAHFMENASFRPLDHNRKAEEEKKRVVDAAMKIASGGMTKEMYEALYDAGYLKLPAE